MDNPNQDSSRNKPETIVSTAKTTGSFADRVDYGAIYGDLATRGILLTDEEKAKLRDICTSELKDNDGGKIITTNPGAKATSMVYMLISAFQNFIKNLLGGGLGSLSSFAEAASGAGTETTEKTKLRDLSLASYHIYDRMYAAGGNLQAAADLVSGSSSRNDPRDMSASVLRQVHQSIDLPWGTNYDLNSSMMFGFNGGAQKGLPNLKTSEPLTQRG